jgi:hypothetical protein
LRASWWRVDIGAPCSWQTTPQRGIGNDGDMPMRLSRLPTDIMSCLGRPQSKGALRPAVVALGLFLSTNAAAQEYAPREVGGWTVAASKDRKGCFVTRDYARPGNTTLLLGVDIDGTNHLSLLNANWSIKPQDQLRLNFRLSTGGYAKHAAVGMFSDGKRGFVTTFEAKFPAYFAASNTLYVARDDVPVERLSLDGSGAAVAELRRCVWIHRVKSTGKASEKARPDAIPTDPFASEPKRKSKK